MTKEFKIMPRFDSFSGSLGKAAASAGSTAIQAMGTLGNIAGSAARVSGAINSAQNAAASVSALRSISLPPGGNPVARFAAGTALFTGAVNQTIGAVGQTIGAVGATAGAIGGALGAIGALTGSSALSGLAGSIGGLAGAFGGLGGTGGGDGDWRAKLTGYTGKLVFPYTPTISIQGGASYEETAITHQNYSFFSYQNSKAETISISAPFYVEDSVQGQAWIDALSFLRASTKMFSDGNPPVILKFNAYGERIFKDVPVIIRNYSVDLPNGVDYINTGSTYVPIKSTFTVGLQPIYSREKIKTFDLHSFINGGSAGFI
jgi:hypothetical protein